MPSAPPRASPATFRAGRAPGGRRVGEEALLTSLMRKSCFAGVFAQLSLLASLVRILVALSLQLLVGSSLQLEGSISRKGVSTVFGTGGVAQQILTERKIPKDEVSAPRSLAG